MTSQTIEKQAVRPSLSNQAEILLAKTIELADEGSSLACYKLLPYLDRAEEMFLFTPLLEHEEAGYIKLNRSREGSLAATLLYSSFA